MTRQAIRRAPVPASLLQLASLHRGRSTYDEGLRPGFSGQQSGYSSETVMRSAQHVVETPSSGLLPNYLQAVTGLYGPLRLL